MKALLIAALVAYIPTAGSLFKRAAARVASLARTREVTLAGSLTVKGEGARAAQLVLHFPLSCRLEADGGVSLAVKGSAVQPWGAGEGTAGPALQMLRMACPFLAHRGLPQAEAEEALKAAAAAAGANPTSGSALARLGDRITYVLGAGARDQSRPQLWLYKDNAAPARLLAQGGADLRFLEYGNPAAAEWFPRVIELWEGGQLAARFEALESRGARSTAEEKEDDAD